MECLNTTVKLHFSSPTRAEEVSISSPNKPAGSEAAAVSTSSQVLPTKVSKVVVAPPGRKKKAL